MARSSFRKGIKRVVSGAIARLWHRPGRTPDEIRAARPHRILIVRPHNQMGDMVCATPCFRAVREAYPEAEIALVCAPINLDVVQYSPHLDRILLFDKRACTRPGPLLAFIRVLRQFEPDLAFVLNSVSYSVTSAALAAVSGAELIVGCDSLPYGFDVSRHAYSLVMPSYPELEGHAVDHNLAPLAAVGIDTQDRSTVLVPAAKERAVAEDIAKDVPGADPLILMHPGAGKIVNLWPTERFAAVAAHFVRAGRRVLVLQGPADAHVMEAFRQEMCGLLPNDLHSAWTELPPVTVGVCAALLERADRFLCNDTGLMHVAGAVGAPTLALFGPTDPASWAPRHHALRPLRHESGELQALDIDQVLQAFLELPGRDPNGV